MEGKEKIKVPSEWNPVSTRFGVRVHNPLKTREGGLVGKWLRGVSP